jgi:hypothetical protein
MFAPFLDAKRPPCLMSLRAQFPGAVAAFSFVSAREHGAQIRSLLKAVVHYKAICLVKK